MNKNVWESDVVVVGAGFAGSILGRLFAQTGKNVKIIERRNHIAGNMFDWTNDDGIRIQKYGPHTFHTSNKAVYNFLCRFCDILPYRLKCEAVVEGVPTPCPFNFKTIDQFYDKEDAEHLKAKLISYYHKDSATVLEMLTCAEPEIQHYAQFLFDKDYKLYTAKQWGKQPEEIDPSVLRRVPIAFHYGDTYFTDQYEGLPAQGYTQLFDTILDHPNISVVLQEDAMKHITVDEKLNKVLFDGQMLPLIFTGPIDELFGWSLGHLPYRSLRFEYESYNKKDYQNVAIVAHPADTAFTRITEYTKLPYQEVGNKTVVAREFSLEYDYNNQNCNEPYYPVLTSESQQMYANYLEYSSRFDNLVLCGRLADFKYYNMDMVIERALSVFEQAKDKFSG